MMMNKVIKAVIRGIKIPSHILQRGWEIGHCPICGGMTMFFFEGKWLRDQYRCIRCYSIPRWRAIIFTLDQYFPDWRKKAIHESSPGGSASRKLQRECDQYSYSHYFPDVLPGKYRDDILCQDIQAMTFSDSCFDLFLTQDVFEHLPNPEAAFAEISRVLRPGGAHIFSVPWWPNRETLIRAELDKESGFVRHLLEPDYHGNPVDSKGTLVFREWGRDFLEVAKRSSGCDTQVIHYQDRKYGLDGEMLYVFIQKKPSVAL
jgi:SAM-dependent methyltransferase